MALGAALATAAAAIGGPLGIAAAAIGAAVTAWNGYKTEPPREVWTDARRQAERAKRGATVQEYDDETPDERRRTP